MEYAAKEYSRLLGTPGFSDELLSNHFTLYQGYVANTNKLLGELRALREQGREGEPVFAELKRRFGWEWNGMRLHELYFENLGGPGDSSRAPRALDLIKASFGSIEQWEKDFRATGAMRGIGWVVLYVDAQTGLCFNAWINEHDVSHPAGCVPLLVMDVFEHAYLTDYGLKRPAYIDAFMRAVDWEAVERRVPVIG
jgi:Fe-Mn family superoxide dismutase